MVDNCIDKSGPYGTLRIEILKQTFDLFLDHILAPIPLVLALFNKHTTASEWLRKYENRKRREKVTLMSYT